MNKLKARQLASRAKIKSDKKKYRFLMLFGVIGVFMVCYFTIKLYSTIIDTTYMWLSFVSIGALGGLISSDFMSAQNGKDFRYFRHYFWSIVIFGGLVNGTFLLVNDLFASKNQRTTKLHIHSRYESHARKGSNSVTVYFNGLKKEINFSVNKQELYSANYAIFTLKKGLFGFDIIEERKLSKN